jgi:putative FmdB family regulatory protein
MPLYEYACDACGRRFEQIQKFSDAPLEICVECGKGPVRRLLSSPAIQFKGAGWYVTDYAKSGAKKETATTESAPSAASSADTTAKADTTPASAAPKADPSKQ